MNSSKQLFKAIFSFSLMALTLFTGLMAEARGGLATSNPVMLSATKDSNTQITVTFDQNVQTNETNPGDFIVTDAAGRTYAVTAQSDGTPGDTHIVLTVTDLSKIVGKLIVTYNNAHNEISDAATGLSFTVTDGAGVVIERPLVFIVEGSGVTLPVSTGTYNYTVDWGDGQVETGLTGLAYHIYNTSGSYTISIYGDYPKVIMNDLQGHVKSLEQWGSIVWESMEGAFEISNMEYNATDAPDLSQVTSMARMFMDNRGFEADISHWDVSNVQDMSEMFAFSSYNQPLSGWDVGNVTNMHRMFYQANQFNQSLNDWNVSKVTDMSEMFYEAFDFNQPLNSWNVGSVVNMSRMFFFTFKFNQPLSDWDVSKVTDMSGMFEDANRFNQPIGDWDVSQVTDMSNMFEDCFRFNQSLSDWDVGKVIDMSDMFYSTGAFNGAIGDWDVSAVTDMSSMFENAHGFKQSLANWDIRSLKEATGMLDFTGMSAGRIDETFMAWNALAVKETGVDFGSADFSYCEADAAIQELINDNGWVFGSSLDQNCEVYVNGVTVVNGTYGIGDNLDIIVTMSLPVALEGGGLAIPLTIGSNQVDAELLGVVNNTQTMTFRYSVKEGDLDEDGIVLGDFISFLNGASILYKGVEDDFSGRLYFKPLTTGVLVDAIKPLSGTISSVQQDSGVGDEDGITNDNTLIFAARPSANGSVLEVADLDDHVSDTYEFFLDNTSIGLADFDETTDSWLLDYTNTILPDGTYALSLATTDTVGNTSAPSPNLTFTLVVDTQVPAGPISGLSSASDTGSSNSDQLTNQTGVTFAGTAEPNSSLEVFVDNLSVGTTTTDTNGDWSFDHSGTVLTEGTHTISAAATDLAGNEGLQGVAESFDIDITPPGKPTLDLTTSSDSGTSDTDNITNATPVWEGTAEAGSTIEIFVDENSVGTTTADGSGNWSFTHTGSALLDGIREITAKAIDIAGNTSNSSDALAMTIDTTAPDKPILDLTSGTDSGSSDTDNITNVTPTWEGTAEAGSAIEIFIDGSSIGTITADGSGSWSFAYTGSALDDGSLAVTAKATDIAGNTSDASIVFTLIVDTTAPDAPVSGLSSVSDAGSSNSDQLTNQAGVTFEGTAEANSSIEVFVDNLSVGTATADINGDWSFDHSGIVLTEGTHMVSAAATDAAGNEGLQGEGQSFDIDITTPGQPTLDLTSGSDSGSSDTDNITSNIPNWEGTAEAGSAVEIFVDGSSVGTTTADGSGSWSFEYSGTALADGSLLVTAKATDLAGNTSDSSDALTMLVDTTSPGKPTLDLTSDTDSGSSDTDNITSNIPTWEGTAEAGSTLEIFVDGSSVGTTTADGSGSWSFEYSGTALADGSLAVTAKATDLAGNTSDSSDALTMLVDTTSPVKPTISLTSSTDSGSSDTDNITNDIPTWEGTAEAGSAVEIFVDGSSVGTTTADGSGNWSFEYSGTALADGSLLVTAKASDLAGNVSDDSDALTMLVDTTSPERPEITHISDDTGNSDSDGITSDRNILLSGTAETNAAVEVLIDGVSQGNVQADNNGNWVLDMTTTTLDMSTYVVTATASDLAGNISEGSDSFSFTVDFEKPDVTLSLFEAPTGASILITAAFSENVTGFSANDVSINDGTLDALEMIDERTYRLSVQAEKSVITVSIDEGLATDLAGNTNTASNQLEVNAIISSLDNFDEGRGLKVYPNPASNVLTIDLSEFNGLPLDVSVLSTAGKTELRQKAFTGRKLSVDTSEYPQGIYLIQVTDGVKLVTQKIMIKR